MRFAQILLLAAFVSTVASAAAPVGATPIFVGTRFAKPVAFVSMPGATDEFFVATRDGQLSILKGDANGALVGVTRRANLALLDFGFDRLRSLVVSPDFAADATVYAFYVTRSPRKGVLARIRLSTSRTAVLDRVLLETPLRNSDKSGGALAFDSRGGLNLALGAGVINETLRSHLIRFEGTSLAQAVPMGFEQPSALAFDDEQIALWMTDKKKLLFGDVDGNTLLDSASRDLVAVACPTNVSTPACVYGDDNGRLYMRIGGVNAEATEIGRVPNLYLLANDNADRLYALNERGEIFVLSR